MSISRLEILVHLFKEFYSVCGGTRKKTLTLTCGFRKKSFTMNAPLVIVGHISHHFWLGGTANSPKSDERYAQLTRGAFTIN